mmetsp:Transcript_77158/g.223964  ORF Transcript_77158/g.223964 Transcript_77158/m.223964 type:complete len:365 (+) Transcript_77158:1302-2396(+)
MRDADTIEVGRKLFLEGSLGLLQGFPLRGGQFQRTLLDVVRRGGALPFELGFEHTERIQQHRMLLLQLGHDLQALHVLLQPPHSLQALQHYRLSLLGWRVPDLIHGLLLLADYERRRGEALHLLLRPASLLLDSLNLRLCPFSVLPINSPDLLLDLADCAPENGKPLQGRLLVSVAFTATPPAQDALSPSDLILEVRGVALRPLADGELQRSLPCELLLAFEHLLVALRLLAEAVPVETLVNILRLGHLFALAPQPCRQRLQAAAQRTKRCPSRDVESHHWGRLVAQKHAGSAGARPRSSLPDRRHLDRTIHLPQSLGGLLQSRVRQETREARGVRQKCERERTRRVCQCLLQTCLLAAHLLDP